MHWLWIGRIGFFSIAYTALDRCASEIAAGLPNGRVIVFEGRSHFPIGFDGMAGMKPPPFVLAGT